MIYKPAQIEKFIKKPDDGLKVVLVYGNNEGLIAETVKNFAQAIVPDLNDAFQVSQLLWDNISGDTGVLAGEYGAQSLMGGRRVVIVRDVDNNLTKPLKEMLSAVKSDALLVLSSSSLNKKSSLVAMAEERDDFAAVPCYEDRDEDIQATARKMFLANGFTISNDTLALLCSRLSNDRKSNLGELEKLVTYMGDYRNITNDDVCKVISDNSATSGDDVCYFTASGQTDKALKAYQKLLAEDGDPIMVVRGLTYHFLRLLNCAAQIEKGETIDNVVNKSSPPIIFFRKASFKAQLALWNKQRLLAAMEHLYKADRDCKTTNMPAEEIVSYLIMALSSATARLKREQYGRY